MGMFDSVYADINCRCGKLHNTEIQFKVYLGDYQPECADYKIGERIKKPFPQINFESIGTFSCDGNYYDIIIEFRKGILENIIFPIPNNYNWTKLPNGKNSQRRQLVEQEEQKRLQLENKSIADIFSDFFRDKINTVGFARRLFITEPYPNYMKTDDGWMRINPL